jgi:hypothetical protein
MKQSRTIVNKSEKKKMGRPRSVSDDIQAPAVAVRLPVDVLAEVDERAAKDGVKRSEVLRDLVVQAIRKRRK